ncbi:DMT family transporter [Actibacterium sp. 188UL27-1]|uniref:DMT family transporter n=1 Tax=Actibacterium sp. 188UL27-1 TaxID=2786961 RepID=UPI0019597AD2|nr:DMT family transporter [Actibacterium sp. 188UL27-1]MBM7066891.1 DMT family transporter [Actibacterium sp. 188UL27-1]
MAVLLVLGLAWGLTMPLAKIAVEAGYGHFGIMVWQAVIGAALLGAILVMRGVGLPLGWPDIRVYVVISLIGAILPNLSYFEAARHLPAGVMSVLVPMFAFAIALALRLERFAALRLVGLGAGLTGILLLIWPDAAATGPAAAHDIWHTAYWVTIATLASVRYGIEGNYVAKFGTAGLDLVQALCGTFIISACLTVPLAVATGSWVSPLSPGAWRRVQS